MKSFQPKLAEADNASMRTAALCEFIEYWLGPRDEKFGEPLSALTSCSLPLPLDRLYRFAGRWPALDTRNESPWAVGAFSCQDTLIPLSKLKTRADGKVAFLAENQECWECRTLASGDDAPVWCEGDSFDVHGKCPNGETLVSDSLSRFLVTFVLQELTLGSRFSLTDEELSKAFESDKSAAIPMWLKGPYVYGDDTDFFLWNEVLVANLWGGFHFGANHRTGVEFLTNHQGAIIAIEFMAGFPWRLDIADDGSARVQYVEGQVREEIRVGPTCFDFPELKDRMSKLVTADGSFERNPIVFFRRQGQTSVQGRNLPNAPLVTALFRQALERSSPSNEKLERLFKEEWPY